LIVNVPNKFFKQNQSPIQRYVYFSISEEVLVDAIDVVYREYFSILGACVQRSNTAVLIADSFGSPFEELKSQIQPELWSKVSGADVFYVRGLKPSRVSEIQNRTSESLRYSHMRPVQRTYDNLALNTKFKKIPSISVTKNEIFVNVSEGLRNLGLKSLAAYDFLYKSGYEIIYKTTLSSIINPNLFTKVIDSIDTDIPLYTGTVINLGKHQFVSGANLILNRKVLSILLERRGDWQHGFLDDVAIGRLLKNYMMDLGLRTKNLENLDDVKSLSAFDLSNIMHFRCKSSEEPRNDLDIMKSLLKRMCV